MNKIYLGDYGVKISVRFKDNIPNTYQSFIEFEKPSGTKGSWIASLTSDVYPYSVKVEYTTKSGDIDEVGIWKLQAVVHDSLGNVYIHSEKFFIEVDGPIVANTGSNSVVLPSSIISTDPRIIVSQTGNVAELILANVPSLDSNGLIVERLSYEGVANGVATLDPNGNVVQRLSYEGVAGGVAVLDANSKLSNRLTYEGIANGVATLDANTRVVQRLSYEGVASGVATLDANSQVVQRLAYEGVANGVAKLDANGNLIDANGNVIKSADVLYAQGSSGTVAPADSFSPTPLPSPTLSLTLDANEGVLVFGHVVLQVNTTSGYFLKYNITVDYSAIDPNGGFYVPPTASSSQILHFNIFSLFIPTTSSTYNFGLMVYWDGGSGVYIDTNQSYLYALKYRG